MRTSVAVVSIGLLLTLPCAALAGAVNTALIVHDGAATSPGPDIRSNLATRLAAKGYTVTQNVGVPVGTLSAYQQIWDLRYSSNGAPPGNAFTSTEITEYTNFLAAGGSLFLMGENGTSFGTRNQAIADFIAAAGGGTVTLMASSGNTQTVQSPFNTPTALTSVTFSAVGGVSSMSKGAFVTKDTATTGCAIVFAPGTLSSAPAGTVIAIFDVNFLQASANSSLQSLTDNIISYMGAPTSVPTMTEWAMILLAASLVAGGVAALTRRRPTLAA